LLLWIFIGLLAISLIIPLLPYPGLTCDLKEKVEYFLFYPICVGIVGIMISGLSMLTIWLLPASTSYLTNVSYNTGGTCKVYSAKSDDSHNISCIQESQSGFYQKESYNFSDVTVLREINPNPRIETILYTGQYRIWWLEPIVFHKSGTIYRLYIPVDGKGNFNVDD
jgi:hypothetical protein